MTQATYPNSITKAHRRKGEEHSADESIGWRFAFSRRWLGYLAFAIAFAIACVFLSHWQLDRSKEAAAANKLASDNFYSTPQPLSAVLPTLTSFHADQEWKRVSITGEYDTSKQMLVRGRPYNGNPGFEVLTPLRLENGTYFLVDRGWIQPGKTVNVPSRVPDATKGPVNVVVRLQPSEPAIPGRTAIGMSLATIQLSVAQQKLGAPLYTGAYGLLSEQTPAATQSATPTVTTPPVEDTGMHWSYMIQWIIFALIGFFGLGYGLRTEFRRLNADDPEERERARERARKRAEHKTDADIEDEILDVSTVH